MILLHELATQILRALSEELSLRILESTTRIAKSVSDLRSELRIPRTSLYRRIAELRSVGLLVTERSAIGRDGKRRKLLRSRFREIHVDYTEGHLKVDAEPNLETIEMILRNFYSLKTAQAFRGSPPSDRNTRAE